MRLGADLERKLKTAAELEGVSESEFIRAAVEERTARTLGDRLQARLSGLVGVVHSQGGRARDAHRRARDLLIEQREKRERR